MPCREAPHIGAMQYVCRSAYLDDVQALSLYANLRREAADAPDPSDVEVFSLKRVMVQRAEERLPAGRRAESVRDKIIGGPDTMDGPTYTALKRMLHASARAHESMSNLDRQIAERHGCTTTQARAAVDNIISRARAVRRTDDPPQAPDHLGYDPAGIPGDRGTRYAYAAVAAHGPMITGSSLQSITSSLEERSRAAAASRCVECGQFAADSGHRCPVTGLQPFIEVPSPSGPAPSPDEVLGAAAAADAAAAAERVREHRAEALATALLEREPEPEPTAEPVVVPEPEPVVAGEVLPTRGLGVAAWVREGLAFDEERADEATIAARRLFADTHDGSSYADDMEQFQEDWDAIKTRFASGDTAITFMTENATGGLSSRENGRAIGLEIEMDFPDDVPNARGQYGARRRLAQRLHDLGISQWNEPLRWRGLRDHGGYSDDPTRWSAQFDASTDDLPSYDPNTGRRMSGQRGVEVVSPILYDSPETWQHVAAVIEAAKAEGAVVNARHGLHVNVDGSDFNHTVENHTSLLRLTQTFEDTLIRTGTNPEAGRWHRGREYCMASTVPSEGFRSIGSARSLNGHHQMVSLTGMPAEGEPVHSSTRLEFRHFDGTLDPGRVQAHTKTALALAAAAKRGVDLSSIETETAGSHRAANMLSNGRMPRLTGDQWEADTRAVRVLADTLFSRREDKRQFLETFASNVWQKAH